MAIEKITVPDYGDVQEITVLEIYVSEGEQINIDDSLVSLESDKAVMDLPCPIAGTVSELKIKEGDTVKSNDLIAVIDTAPVITDFTDTTHAPPSTRAYARETGVDLAEVDGSGPKGRVMKNDVDAFRSSANPEKSKTSSDFSLPVNQPPLDDFSKFGVTEIADLSRIQKISGPHLFRSWVSIPHVTHFDETDITDLQAFKRHLNDEALRENENKFSLLVFIVKAVVFTLKNYPIFNCSLTQNKEKIVLKKYYNIGIAVDTPDGLVVPVIKNADKKGIKEINTEMERLSSDARAGKLTIPDIQGASFTISSLGNIGGTAFTPIVNGSQVAILGVSKSYTKPYWDGKSFVPRLTLPFSVSYDHRVIDGAAAARFCRSLGKNIEDLRRTLL